ncbi:MAG: amidohydrolase family protein [Spirochaetales bacterium]|jgi:N-acyl-D-aspartate/D-glutamate deacylase|nr:amidohydrolase family protein [Spirochaetales bacterium]
MVDLIIANGNIVDGSGNEPYTAALALHAGKIVRIAPRIDMPAEKIIDAAGEYVTPGFIDMHRHSDAVVFSENFGELQLRQGITSTINGNCGLSVVPLPEKWRREILSYLNPIVGELPSGKKFETFSEYLALLEGEKLPINFGMYIGNGTLRTAVKGFEKGELSGEELSALHGYLEDALAAGAFGVSMGLAYMPENFYGLEGFARALAPLRGSSRPLVTHIRGEGNLLVESLEEVIRVAISLGVPLHISHFKCLGRKNWGHLLEKAIGVLDRAREGGQRLTCDVYPWTAGSTQLVQVLPPEFLEGGLDKTTQRLKDPLERKRCKEILSSSDTDFENQIDLVGWENIMVSSARREENLSCVGKRITEIAAERGQDPFEAAFLLLASENCDVSMINFIACEEDIKTILHYPHSAVISDSIYPAGGMPHPRQYGTFAKLLADYVRDTKVLSLPEAIHKITRKPAEILSIENKGLIKEGFDADIAVFNLERIKNNATYLKPKELAEGFSYVLVGGVIANDHDRFLKTSSGKVLRRR